MHSPGINGEGELRGQPAIAGSPEKMAVKMERERERTQFYLLGYGIKQCSILVCPFQTCTGLFFPEITPGYAWS